MESSNNNQSNHHFSYRISVNSSLEETWSFLCNVERWPEWDTELLSAQLEGDFSVGAKGRLEPKKGPKLKFYISDIVPKKSYTFVTKMPVGTLEIKRSFTQTSNGIEFLDDIQFTGILKRIFGLLLGGGFRKSLPEVMQNFKRILEKGKL